MPEIHRFSKPEIVLQIYPREPRHHGPHFHAKFQGKQMSIGIDNLDRKNGFLPRNAKRAVFSWARENQGFLREAWEAVQSGCEVPRLEE